MAEYLEDLLLAQLPDLWDEYNAAANPSPESIAILREIRNTEKLLRATQATMRSRGWPIQNGERDEGSSESNPA